MQCWLLLLFGRCVVPSFLLRNNNNNVILWRLGYYESEEVSCCVYLRFFFKTFIFYLIPRWCSEFFFLSEIPHFVKFSFARKSAGCWFRESLMKVKNQQTITFVNLDIRKIRSHSFSGSNPRDYSQKIRIQPGRTKNRQQFSSSSIIILAVHVFSALFGK